MPNMMHFKLKINKNSARFLEEHYWDKEFIDGLIPNNGFKDKTKL